MHKENRKSYNGRQWRRLVAAAAALSSSSSSSLSLTVSAFSLSRPLSKSPVPTMTSLSATHSPTLTAMFPLHKQQQELDTHQHQPQIIRTTCLLQTDAVSQLGWSMTASSSSSNCANRYGGRAIAQEEHSYHNRKTVLGFTIDESSESGDETTSHPLSNSELRASSSSSSSSSSHTSESSSKLSSIDKSKWRSGHELFLQDGSTATTSSPIKNQNSLFSSSSSTRNNAFPGNTFESTMNNYNTHNMATNTIIPAWFPWIPTREQIEILKVVELKEACQQRNLRKTGNKHELQTRLWSWTQEQHEKRVADRQRGSDGVGKQNNSDTTTTTTTSTRTTTQFSNNNGSNGPSPTALDMGLPLTDMYGSTPSDRSSTSSSSGNNSKKHGTTSSKNAEVVKEWPHLDALFNRREEIRKEKRQGRKTIPPQNSSTNNNRSRRQRHGGRTSSSASTSKSSFSSSRKSNNKTNNKAYLSKLFEAPPAQYSNIEIKQMYHAMKSADQRGDRMETLRLLQTLQKATPHDGRIIRRLARFYQEDGQLDLAKSTLLSGIQALPSNAHLWHGLGQLEYQQFHNYDQARYCFQQAIHYEPTFPNSYHALGTLEHSQVRIASAMNVLKQGLEYCPSNHRLHHALGDVYRDAKLLRMAERSYQFALEQGPPVSHGFALTALAMVAYEKSSWGECRSYLQRAVKLNHGRNSRAWIAWGQMEESLGNIDEARSIYVKALAHYETGLLQRHQHYQEKQQGQQKQQHHDPHGRHSTNTNSHRRHPPSSSRTSSRNNNRYHPGDKHKSNYNKHKNDVLETIMKKNMTDPVTLKNALLKQVPPYRSGDYFIQVYRNWARLEERYGMVGDGSSSSNTAVDEVYARATSAFPQDYQLPLKWAQYHASKGRLAKARSLFELSCIKSFKRHADPYRIYAEFEMSLGHYQEAKEILYRGAQAMSVSSDGGLGGNRRGMAQLYHTWAVCEWYLDNLPRAEVLLDHALRLIPTSGGSSGKQQQQQQSSSSNNKIRSFILFTIAQLEYYRDEYEVAQHCIALCLKENVMPGGNSKIWLLWADIAEAMGNMKLHDQCMKQADMLKQDEDNGGVESLSRLLLDIKRRPTSSTSAAVASKAASTNGSSSSTGTEDIQHLMRRDPWAHKIFGSTNLMEGFESVKLPTKN